MRILIIVLAVAAFVVACSSGGPSGPDADGYGTYSGKWSYHRDWPDSVNYGGPNGFVESGCNACHMSELNWSKLVPDWKDDPRYIGLEWQRDAGITN